MRYSIFIDGGPSGAIARGEVAHTDVWGREDVRRALERAITNGYIVEPGRYSIVLYERAEARLYTFVVKSKLTVGL